MKAIDAAALIMLASPLIASCAPSGTAAPGAAADMVDAWIVAIEAATLITVVMVSIYRTREAIEASWKYFILGSVGIALALFGTILVYLAAQPVIGEGTEALSWTRSLASDHANCASKS